MKHFHLGRPLAVTTWALLVIACIAFFGPLGALVALVNPSAMPVWLGASYPVPNTATAANLVAMTPKVQEEIWVKRIIAGADALYQDNPFADGMSGAPGAGKAIVKITDTEKVAGNTINIPTMAGFGGPGVAGNANRLGAEQKLFVGNFQLQIGRFWYGVAFDSIAIEETVIGTQLDRKISDGIRRQLAKKQSDDTMRKMTQYGVADSRNYLLPEGVSTYADLVSANTISTALISNGGLSLTSLGALPMSMGNDASGSTFSNYVLLGTNHGFRPLDTEDAYRETQLHAGVRGEQNPLVTGRYTDCLGHMLYRWNQIDHGNRGPVGSPLLGRAFLGNAGTFTSGSVIQGGGSAAAAAVLPAPAFFENFSNAPWGFINNETIAAVTNVTKHILIKNPDNSYGVFPYQVNDGHQITLSGNAIAIGVGTETTTFVEGALIHQCNIQGTTTGKFLFLGAEAVVAGYGSINGSKAIGKRTEKHDNYDMDHGIGFETAWGCNTIVQPNGIRRGFVVIEAAVPVPGAPVIV